MSNNKKMPLLIFIILLPCVLLLGVCVWEAVALTISLEKQSQHELIGNAGEPIKAKIEVTTTISIPALKPNESASFDVLMRGIDSTGTLKCYLRQYGDTVENLIPFSIVVTNNMATILVRNKGAKKTKAVNLYVDLLWKSVGFDTPSATSKQKKLQ